jgi:aryl-alcohol dehydrogenase
MVTATAIVVPKLHAPFQLVQVELDSLRPDEVLVQLKATSICATDGAVQHGKIPLAFPAVLGHEGVFYSQPDHVISAKALQMKGLVL